MYLCTLVPPASFYLAQLYFTFPSLSSPTSLSFSLYPTQPLFWSSLFPPTSLLFLLSIPLSCFVDVLSFKQPTVPAPLSVLVLFFCPSFCQWFMLVPLPDILFHLLLCPVACPSSGSHFLIKTLEGKLVLPHKILNPDWSSWHSIGLIGEGILVPLSKQEG